jgi:2-keto-4-pentenoate hydratase/2-oxohepta-3-ene-1,7-dioic acid hydratase in catechol pathway
VRLATSRGADGDRPVAIIAGDGGERVLDLGHLAADLVSLISDGAALGAARTRVAEAEVPALPALDPTTLQAPVVPGKIVCLGYNYRGHVPDGVDATADDPATPDVFVKTPNTLAGPNESVVIPDVATDADYEGELAVVIGRRAHQVPVGTALEHVAGYTILNDVSDRSWQRRQSQWALGKCFDGFAPLGPWLMTPDEVPDPQNLLIEVLRDGALTVSQSTSTTVFSVAFVVHYLSQVMTLEPGDVISTGTPQKLDAAQRAHRPLADGDAVTVRIAGIGELTTRFIAPPEASP